MNGRLRLANRRRSEIACFELAGIRFRATISRFDDGKIGEIFLDTNRPCSAVAVAARDIGIAASLALQSGCEVETLRKALQRLSDGGPAGPLCGALDLFAGGSPQ